MSKTAGVVLLVAGAAAAIAGGALLIAAARRRNEFGQGLETEESRAGGMKITRYTHPTMPIGMRIALIQGMVLKGIKDPRMRKIALDATARCPERDGECEARAVYDAVKGRVRYTGDIGKVKIDGGVSESVDLYQSPYRTWEFKGGDCDDHVGLNATLLALNGITPKLRVTSRNPDRTVEDYGHIYAVACMPKTMDGEECRRTMALDTTLPGANNFGREASYGKRRDFDA